MRKPASEMSDGELSVDLRMRVGGELTTNDIVEYLISHMTMVNELKATISARPLGWAYLGMEDFLLKHGRFWTPRQLPPGVPRMTRQMCFNNAFKLASRRSDLRYVEGIAYSVLPIHHAWCVDADNNVIDPTWANTSFDLGDAYFGVAFPLSVVREIRHVECLSVLDNWKSKHAIYKQPFAI